MIFLDLCFESPAILVYYERMKPVRTVQDIVRRKALATKSGDAKVTFKNAASVAMEVFKSSGARIPFLIWFAVILAESIFLIKIAAEIIPRQFISQLSDVAIKSNLAAIVSENSAIVQNVFAPLDSVSTSSATSSNEMTAVEQKAEPAEPPPMTQPALPFKTTSATATSAAVSNKKTAIQPSKPKPAQIQTVVTAKSLIDATTLSTSERRDGPYKVELKTNAGTYGVISWDLGKTQFTVSPSMPSFSISYSCNPSPNMPDHDALDQSPMFNVQTSYKCTISLTPTSGNDRQTQSKQFSFTTGAGQLFITSQSSMNTVLKDNLNTGGFVFRNDDIEPVTVTGIDIDVSYRGLDTTDSPLILRFKDTATELALAEYNLENLAADPSISYAHSGTNIHIPLSFVVNSASQKLLPISVLGVHRLSIYGVNPIVDITLRKITIDKSANKIILSIPKISWSCIVPIGAYNPNATSGPYATGQACL
ncbi:MAG: hypothetical protein AAB602_04025 [Patescibacteria group bacterium]